MSGTRQGFVRRNWVVFWVSEPGISSSVTGSLWHPLWSCCSPSPLLQHSPGDVPGWEGCSTWIFPSYQVSPPLLGGRLVLLLPIQTGEMQIQGGAVPKLPKLSTREAGMEHNFSSAPRGPDFAECAALPSESEQHPVPGAVRICLEGAETLLQWTKNYLFLVQKLCFQLCFFCSDEQYQTLAQLPLWQRCIWCKYMCWSFRHNKRIWG